jgi:hypothetical protein
MEKWAGNKEAFKTYFQGKLDKDGKCIPAEKVKGMPGHSWDDICVNENFGAVLNDGFIDISYDSPELSTAFWNMADINKWECLILENPENGHIHSIWRKPRNWKFKDGADLKLAVGLVADIHSGSTYIRLRVNSIDRSPIYEPDHIQEVPEELFPVSTQKELWRMSEGEGRNDELFGYIQVLQSQLHLPNDTIRRILNSANEFVFSDSLASNELEIILRDEAFEKLEIPALTTMSASDLAVADIKPTEFIINSLIPVGLVVLASPPKYGKSYMVLDMALCVASGREFLGFTTNKCGVLYLSLEDRWDRLRQRMLQVIGNQAIPGNFYMNINSQTLDNGLIEQLQDFLQIHPEIRLIIIDTFQKIRGEQKRTESAYAADSREMGVLKKFADDHSISILLVTHTRKMRDLSDPFANITGTHGISGIADDSIVLTKEKREDVLTKMSVAGRDVCYEDYPIIFNKELGRWMRQGDSYELVAAQTEIECQYMKYLTGGIRNTILKLLEENNGIWQGRCSEIIEKSRECGMPISLTAAKLGKELTSLNDFLYRDNIVHTEIANGTGAKAHKFEKV